MNKPAITALLTVREFPRTELPDAHFKEFDGRHLYRLMVEKLLAVKAINHIVITTDSPIVRQTCGGTPKICIRKNTPMHGSSKKCQHLI